MLAGINDEGVEVNQRQIVPVAVAAYLASNA